MIAALAVYAMPAEAQKRLGITPASPTHLSVTAGDEDAARSWANPTNTTVFGDRFSNDGAAVRLTWDQETDTDIDRYYYRVSADGGITWERDWTAIPGSSWQTVTYTVTGLNYGILYTFQVRAVKETAGDDVLGDIGQITYKPLRPAPANLVAVPDSGRVHLAWDRNPAVTDYRVDTEVTSTGTLHEPSRISAGSGPRTYATISALTNDTEYTFTVVAVKGFLDTSDPSSVNATPAVPPVPDAPANLSAKAKDSRVTLFWEYSGDLTISMYQVSTDDGVTFTGIAGSSVATTTHTVTRLTNRRQYTFAVRAVNSFGDGGASTVAARPVNEAPTASHTTVSTIEDNAYTFAAADFGFQDADDTLDHVKITSLPGAGTLSFDGMAIASAALPQRVTSGELDDDRLRYIPPTDAAGHAFAIFGFKVNDGEDDSRSVYTVTIDVVPVNDAPVALDDRAETDEDTAVKISVLANDTDPDGDRLAVKSVTQPSHGSAKADANGVITYTPDQNFHGTDEFEYAASDGELQTNATVTVTVRPVNDAPEANDDAAETDEDTPVEIAVLANDTDVDGDEITAVLVTEPSHGTAAVNDGTTITYTPDQDFHGTDEFVYAASDGELQTNATVTVTVRPVNDGPEATDDEAETDEDTSVEIDVLANDADRDGDRLSVNSVTDPEHGIVTVNRDGTVTYAPDANYYGGDAFEYTISDGRATATAAVTVTVHPVNDAPVAEDDAAQTLEDNGVAIPVLDNDSDPEGSSLSVESATQPSNGTASANADGTVSYTPNENYHGADSFQYTVTDGEATAMATVSVTIHSVNDPPAATGPMPDMALIVGKSSGSVDAAGFFEDVDGDPLEFGAVSSEAGVASVSASGSALTVTAVSEGAATITVTASDGQASATQTFSVTVRVDEQAEKQMVENVLAAMGRNMLTSVTTAIAGRFSGSGGGAGLTVAGRQMSLGDGSVLMALADLAGARRGPGEGRERMSGAELVRSSSFTLPLGQQSSGGRWALWGQGDLRSFEGADYAGDLTTGYAGLDFRAGSRWVAGVSVSRGGGDMAYSVLGGRDRQMTTTMTGVYPYLRWQPGRNTEIWTIAGMGRGDLENQRAGRLEQSDLSMRMGVVGLRQSLAGSGALRFGLRGDAGYVRLSTAEGSELTDGLAADAMRIRLGLEGSYTASLGSSVALEPFAEAGAVRDGGDGDTGNGLEVAGGLRLGGSRVHIEARGRMMAIHTAENYKEHGFSVAAAVNAGEGGSGLSMSLAPRWGARTESAGTLWRDEGLREVAEGRPGVGPGSLDAKIGYGVGVGGGASMLTPFGELNLSGSDSQRAQIGARLAMPESAGQMLSLELAAMRGRRTNEAPKYGLALRGSLKLR